MAAGPQYSPHKKPAELRFALPAIKYRPDRYCVHCGVPVKAEWRKCEEKLCELPIGPLPKPKLPDNYMFCGWCTYPIKKAQRFCQICKFKTKAGFAFMEKLASHQEAIKKSNEDFRRQMNAESSSSAVLRTSILSPPVVFPRDQEPLDRHAAVAAGADASSQADPFEEDLLLGDEDMKEEES